MGLGKTVQSIAFLAHLKSTTKGPFLATVIVPSSVLDNWAREIAMWTPSLNVCYLHGPLAERQQLAHELYKDRHNYDIVLSTYNIACGKEGSRVFRKAKRPYSCAIFDEGHMLKNFKTNRFKQLMAVKSKRLLLLTGTPLQNNLLELMSLLTFTMPSMFYSDNKQDEEKVGLGACAHPLRPAHALRDLPRVATDARAALH